MVFPGHRQLADVVRGDLIEAGETLAGVASAIRGPVTARRLSAAGGRHVVDPPLLRVRIVKHQRNHDQQHYAKRTAEQRMKTTVIGT